MVSLLIVSHQRQHPTRKLGLVSSTRKSVMYSSSILRTSEPWKISPRTSALSQNAPKRPSENAGITPGERLHFSTTNNSTPGEHSPSHGERTEVSKRSQRQHRSRRSRSFAEPRVYESNPAIFSPRLLRFRPPRDLRGVGREPRTRHRKRSASSSSVATEEE